MEQLRLTYFWPLTEQIALDLDYQPCWDYANKLRESTLSNALSGQFLIAGVDGNTWSTAITNNLVNPTITFNSNGEERMKFDENGIQMTPGNQRAGYWAINGNDFRIYREQKPSYITRKATKFIFGWIWNDE